MTMVENPLRQFKYNPKEPWMLMAEHEKLLFFNGNEIDSDDITLENIFPPDEFSNVIILVEDIELHLHKDTLRMGSPVFKAMLGENFVEGKEGKIVLPEKKAEIMILFFSFFYSDREVPLKDKFDFFSLLSLCEEYQTDWLKKEVMQHLYWRINSFYRDESYAVDPKRNTLKDFKHRFSDFRTGEGDTRSYDDTLVMYCIFLAEQFDSAILLNVCRKYIFELRFYYLEINKMFQFLSEESKMLIRRYAIKRTISIANCDRNVVKCIDKLTELKSQKCNCSTPKKKKMDD